jgi:hypothetical protein
MKLAERFLEITLTVLIIYYVAVHARGISMVIQSVGSFYVGAVKTLQGR